MSKIDDCYEISSQIVNKYTDLILSSVYSVNAPIYIEQLAEIKKLVTKEYNIVCSMSFDELEECIKYTESIRNYYTDRVIIRTRNKLLNYRDVLTGKGISCDEFGVTDSFRYMSFSISDAIVSMIDIDVIKAIKRKIYSLIPASRRDINFIRNLKDELLLSEIDLLYSVSVAEMCALCNNGDIDKISRIDINRIKDKINMLGNCDSDKTIGFSIAIYAKQILDELSNIEKVDNNVYGVFSYLVAVTRIEVLVSYMDISLLKIIYDYCCNITNSSNTASLTIPKNFIKTKMKQ